MTELKRLVIDFRTGDLAVRCLYRTEGESGPNTKGRWREVTDLAREGLSAALEAFAGRVDVVGTSGFTTREDTSYVLPRVPHAQMNIRQSRKEPSGRSTRRYG
jgi:hypothetical protein